MDDKYYSNQMLQDADITPAESPPAGPPGLLLEMMRSFTMLARTLNLSQAVEELGSTRQTVRRHISQLEAAMGCKLFEVQHRRYMLTDEGARALEPAQRVIDQGEVWYKGNFNFVEGLSRVRYDGDDGVIYHQQELPLSHVWQGQSKLLRASVKAWSQSEGQLEAPAMELVRPYILGYREIEGAWICVEVGEKSFYSNWFGWAHARSSVGRNLNQFPGGQAFATLANAPFRQVHAGADIRLDQVVTRMRFQPDEPMSYVIFDRLLFGVRLPDQSPAVISVVDRAEKVLMDGFDPNILEEVPENTRVDFDPPD